jgi:pimeloyl-ACP methyl ester carboxylesterase
MRSFSPSIRTGIVLSALLLTAAQLRGQSPAPEVVQLRTADGVQLTISYYASHRPAGRPQAKQVTPVILLHDHMDTRAIFGSLATQLQAVGQNEIDQPAFAAVTVDLRGHGDSTKQIFPNGFQQDIDAAKLKKDDFIAMARLDMEEVRRFLVTKNDEGALNLNKLCIVGSGMGANVGANWAAQDWLAPPLAIGKQGQDVKAMVMISPRWSYQGLTLQAPMRLRPLKQFAAWMLIYGQEDPKFAADIRRIEKQLAPFHPETDERGAPRSKSLVVLELPSALQGDSLLTQLATQVDSRIIAFLLENVAQNDLPWTSRRGRLP